MRIVALAITLCSAICCGRDNSSNRSNYPKIRFRSAAQARLQHPEEDNAWHELVHLYVQGKLSLDEAYLRFCVVYFALHSDFDFESQNKGGPWRNPLFWTDDGWDKPYYVRSDRRPSDAIIDLWEDHSPNRTKTACKKGVQLCQLRALVALSRRIDKRNGDHDALNYLNSLINTRVPTDLLEEGEILAPTILKKSLTNRDGFSLKSGEIAPGDRIFILNDFRYGLHGEDGCNAIYIGNGKLVSFDGNVRSNMTAFRNYMRKNFKSIPPDAPASRLRIKRVYKIEIPFYFRMLSRNN